MGTREMSYAIFAFSEFQDNTSLKISLNYNNNFFLERNFRVKVLRRSFGVKYFFHSKYFLIVLSISHFLYPIYLFYFYILF